MLTDYEVTEGLSYAQRKRLERKRASELEETPLGYYVDSTCRCYPGLIKRAVISNLKKAGQDGMTIKELARKTGLAPCSISGWLYNNLARTLKITKVDRGLYAYQPQEEEDESEDQIAIALMKRILEEDLIKHPRPHVPRPLFLQMDCY